MKIEGHEVRNPIIGGAKPGFKNLNHAKWVSASGFHISVAGVVGVAGLALALLRHRKLGTSLLISDLAKEDNRLEKLYFLPGLQNLGNNCFLNVILQALASCSYFQPSLRKIIEECGSSATEDCTESLPLTVSLADLLEELCAFGEQKVILTPRKVMLAMGHHVQSFNLTNQQDAEEAFLHLLSSLRKEFSDCYPMNQSTLLTTLASPSFRMLGPKREKIYNEQERWQQHFLGPFDGILGSILTCQSCSSQISLNFQFFHSLPLLPVLQHGVNIRAGCTLEDCLKQFIVAEQVENYSCSHCWHIAAIKYLSVRGASEMEVEKLKRCSKQDFCGCQSLKGLESLPWSKKISRTLKQLCIARSPKILCIHMQRVSVNQYGDLVKLQGHISFPLILNLLPFMLEETQCQKPSTCPNTFKGQSNSIILDCLYGQNPSSERLSADEFGCIEHIESFLGDSNLAQTKASSCNVCMDVSLTADDRVGQRITGMNAGNLDVQAVPAQPHTYHLVSVVEHLGRAGGGHYMVYRSMRTNAVEECPEENFKSSLMQWFCISDSEVYSVSEEDVLAAEASLLFYERTLED